MINHSSSLVRFCHKAFYGTNTKLFNVVGDVLSIIIIISVLSIILEWISALSAYHYLFNVIEYVSVAIFTIEYLGRVIGAEKKKDYIFSFWGLIDLLAILPTFLQLANLTLLKLVRALRILRFARTFRLVELLKFEHLSKRTNEDKKEREF